MTSAEHSDLVGLSDAALLRVVEELEQRQPGERVPGTGIRPRRLPWTYRDLRRLGVAREELAWRKLR